MKYGLTRRLNAYSIEKQVGLEIIATAGDYLQSQLWCQKHLKGMDEQVADIYQTFAWAWFALKRNGKLEEFGIGAELTLESLNDMAGDVTVYMDVLADDSLPLKGSGTAHAK